MSLTEMKRTRRLTPILRLLPWLLFACACSDDNLRLLVNADVPDYCQRHIQRQVAALRRVSPTGTADLVFITDTHYRHNELASPAILSYLLRHGVTERIVWGGDALTSHADIPAEWSDHQRTFLSAVLPEGRYYMVRGNHEHTTKDRETGVGQTYTQLQTAMLMSQYSEADVVRPADDPGACYYYVDVAEQQLRYCVFDSTDSITSPTLPWATVSHMSPRQLAWMDRNALHGVPAGYGLVIFAHIGVVRQTFAQHGPYEPLRQLLLRAEAPVLLVLSGHLHQDFQTYDEGILHVLTGSDALYQDYSRSPFLHDVQRESHHASAQLMDLISFTADRRTVHAIRIGAGYSRTFHLDAIGLSLHEDLPLDAVLASAELAAAQPTLQTYDATGYAAQDAAWDPPSTILELTPEGRLHPLRPGSAVLMLTDGKDRREFFNVIVE